MATSLLLVAQEQAPSFAQNPGFLNADRLIQEDSFYRAFDFANATKQLRAFRDHVDKVEALNPESGHLREHMRVKEHIREAEDVVDPNDGEAGCSVVEQERRDRNIFLRVWKVARGFFDWSKCLSVGKICPSMIISGSPHSKMKRACLGMTCINMYKKCAFKM